jgi:hypothetical protein
MSSSANRALQQKARILKAQNIERNIELSAVHAIHAKRVQITRPLHKRHEQRTRLLAHW